VFLHSQDKLTLPVVLNLYLGRISTRSGRVPDRDRAGYDPPAVLFFALQREFISGLTSARSKGRMPVSRRRTFRNPILAGFYPDPVCAGSEATSIWSAAASSISRAFPFFHSRDLVHWQQLGHVLARKSSLT